MRKHLISALVVFIFSVLFFSVSASAGEATKAEEWYNSSYAVTGMVMEVAVDDGDTEIVQTVHSKGEKAASEIVINGSAIRLIIDNGDLIVFSPDVSIIHLKFSGLGGMFTEIYTPEIPEGFNLIFVKEYRETLGDTTYTVEEFTDKDGNNCKYYFSGNELDFIEAVTEADDIEITMVMDILSYEVDESIFEVPWYSINIAPLVMLFALLGI